MCALLKLGVGGWFFAPTELLGVFFVFQKLCVGFFAPLNFFLGGCPPKLFGGVFLPPNHCWCLGFSSFFVPQTVGVWVVFFLPPRLAGFEVFFALKMLGFGYFSLPNHWDLVIFFARILVGIFSPSHRWILTQNPYFSPQTGQVRAERVGMEGAGEAGGAAGRPGLVPHRPRAHWPRRLLPLPLRRRVRRRGSLLVGTPQNGVKKNPNGSFSLYNTPLGGDLSPQL